MNIFLVFLLAFSEKILLKSFPVLAVKSYAE